MRPPVRVPRWAQTPPANPLGNSMNWKISPPVGETLSEAGSSIKGNVLTPAGTLSTRRPRTLPLIWITPNCVTAAGSRLNPSSTAS
eukprot:5179094-Amphidinium_carterae.1